jgi:hypothetical protein
VAVALVTQPPESCRDALPPKPTEKAAAAEEVEGSATNRRRLRPTPACRKLPNLFGVWRAVAGVASRAASARAPAPQLVTTPNIVPCSKGVGVRDQAGRARRGMRGTTWGFLHNCRPAGTKKSLADLGEKAISSNRNRNDVFQ